jgi:hypothetical protein
MLTFNSQSNFGYYKESWEGELSYHARVAEGGSSAFIVPNTGEIYLVDQGRICKKEGFYRNSLGEVFNRLRTRKWEKFEIGEENGG